MPFKRNQELIDRLKREQERIQAATVRYHDAADPSLKAALGLRSSTRKK